MIHRSNIIILKEVPLHQSNHNPSQVRVAPTDCHDQLLPGNVPAFRLRTGRVINLFPSLRCQPYFLRHFQNVHIKMPELEFEPVSQVFAVNFDICSSYSVQCRSYLSVKSCRGEGWDRFSSTNIVVNWPLFHLAPNRWFFVNRILNLYFSIFPTKRAWF